MTFVIWFLPGRGDVIRFNSLCHDPALLVVFGSSNLAWLETDQISGENIGRFWEGTLLGLPLVLLLIFPNT